MIRIRHSIKSNKPSNSINSPFLLFLLHSFSFLNHDPFRLGRSSQAASSALVELATLAPRMGLFRAHHHHDPMRLFFDSRHLQPTQEGALPSCDRSAEVLARFDRASKQVGRRVSRIGALYLMFQICFFVVRTILEHLSAYV